MESQSSSKINYLFLPPLKYLALVKVASTLWNQSDVRDAFAAILSVSGSINKDDWQLLENTVVEKVSELQLPRELENLLFSFIEPLGLQIRDWINFHMVQHSFVAHAQLPREFSWTPQGTIDYKKVAETLVNDKRILNFVRLELACIYCLEEYITLLFKELPSGCFKEHKDPIVQYWAYYVVGDIDQLLYSYSGEDVTSLQMGFEISICTGNVTGTRYFLKRLIKDRAKMLVQCKTILCINPRYRFLSEVNFSEQNFASSLCYILSEMNADELLELVSANACDVLHWLLYWPWQSLISRTAKAIWRFLKAEDYYSLLKTISEKIMSEDKDFNYQYLFYEFWNEGSTAFKLHVITKEGLKSVLPLLFAAAGDLENIKFIFEVATVLEKEEFIFCHYGLTILHELIDVGCWKMLKLFIEKCIPSKNALELHEKFKISGFLSRFHSAVKEDFDILNKFYQVLWDIEQENRNKCIDEVSSVTNERNIC